MSSFRLNRFAFRAQTAEQAANQARHYKHLTWQERLRVAGYLNSMAFDYPENKVPKMDRTKFKVRARSNE